ncbi:hypothetical protein F5J12DRAFT_787126 [Pisolithus orientalis]|uniref:uncharacterized protein n=1 Tax=Pisolithus orientalis TaxID=936130 RepID=UPI00222492F0|nr:uncharacterized protein F5J12DRAFT_787126 [Pisolithus orientalis]KAI5987138.1 hypothetical protein F5J12DRAFT_787126 [Pisolithus orientalis]
MTLVTQYWRFVSAITLPKGHHTSDVQSTLYAQFGYQSHERDRVYWTVSTLLSSVTAIRGLNDSFSVYPEETHFLGLADRILLFWILIGIPPICFHFNSIFLIHYSNFVFHSWQSTPKDMIGKLKLQCAVQPPKGWEEHMFGLRDRRHSLTPHPSIMNTPMLPSPSLHLDNQICDEDSAMEEMEENPDNNKNEDDQPSSNENEDDQLSSSKNKDDLPSGSEEEDDLPSSSEKEDDQLPSSGDDNKGSNYNENDDKMESSSNSCDDDDPCTHNAQTISCAQSLLPPSSPPVYKSDDSAHPVGDVVHPCQEGGPIYTRLQKKGKGRAIDAEDIDAENHSDRDTQLLNLKKLGNLSTAALDEICAFAKDASHTKINEANLFCSWYWATQPKPDGANQNSINNLITKEYNTLMIGIPKDDFAARREKLKAMSGVRAPPPYRLIYLSNLLQLEWTMQRHNFLDWYVVATVQPSILIVPQAEARSNLEDIEIVGVVMYVGQDPAGHQTSGIFGGSKMIRKFMNENGIDVWSLMDKYTAIFRCLRNGNGVDARVASTSSIGDETPRDCNHRVFGSMMKEKMLATLRDLHVTCGIEVGNPQKVSWHQLLEFLWKSHLTIVNWPHGVSPLGPGFKYKKFKAGPLCQLVVPCLWRKLGLLYDEQTDDEEEQDSLDDVLEIEIKCWNEEVIDILDADPLKGEIVLVKATNGTVLQQISDDPEWQKSLKEMDHQQQGMEQPHVEASNCDTIGPQYLLTFARLYSLTVELRHMINAGIHAPLCKICVMTHPQFQAMCTLESLAHLSLLHWLHNTGIYIRIIFQAVLTCKRLAQPSSLFPDDKILGVTVQTIMILAHLISHIMHYLLATTINFLCLAKDSIMFCLEPIILTTMLGEPHWVNRGNAAQYEDDFAEEYINEDYY